jgi:hypothetical protein
MASTAKITPRLNPMVGAELGPVIAAKKPILIGSDCAIAGFGNENAAAPSAPVVPNKTSRRETAINSSRSMLFRRPSLPRALVAVFLQPFSALGRNRFAQIKFEPDVAALSRASASSL